ncbi:peptidase [Mycolicibacterium elephantis]|uniref:Peptidase n=1 Tax=Mycolicibacterium elephantis TaxID=81858 RepID=A0A1X0D2Z7_9MYCO|nr:basic secretory protein-like protein [Mycolicibacterium elephantis]ORA66767.1 peptidase [Mycolicibacterium elephantis]
MRRSTTSAGTDRRAHARSRKTLGALLVAELLCALLLVGRVDSPSGPVVATPASLTTPSATATSRPLSDGRTVRLIGLGGNNEPLLSRVAAEMDEAAAAVSAFWGDDWPREIVVVAAGSAEQFAAVGGGDSHTAATATAERIMFAPDAGGMSDEALRIVLRHELFHYAAREQTAADAPQWLTEGVADFVARPAGVPSRAVNATLPTDAELAGPQRSAAYDRAWLFSRFVADEYGVATLRQLYLRACGHDHTDTATALREVLGEDPQAIMARWRQWM